MFAPSFTRVVRSATSTSNTSAAPVARAALSTASIPFRPLHNRRYSSSKAPLPPSNKKKPVDELEQNAATQLGGKESSAKTKGKITEIPRASPISNVPHVPATTHLHEVDVRVSSFFALHRPISFHSEAWQPPASMEVFEALFKPADPQNPKTIERTKQTLAEFVQSLYASLDGQEEFEADNMFILDEANPEDDALQRYLASQPAFPPPPPVPVPTEDVFERFTEVALPSDQTGRSATFREHVQRRRGGMFLISVKRQRKLKMKKHKYKKLMKRTRLLRRKLDRT
ncbi:hypothetical protein BDU57DRAFT_538044 [Ampelomyces quisqualis]|uniref:Small ribosomal subunit protein mS38 n=1 Tax=Ampelomyces quisqualis TaxID=50730 RepID=A0A6A5QSW1_AMPQU|nr:hypothetical protein BDU57DRAFT_538044 [Ampelomyces quisqualis]